jgi:hypothetical protein
MRFNDCDWNGEKFLTWIWAEPSVIGFGSMPIKDIFDSIKSSNAGGLVSCLYPLFDGIQLWIPEYTLLKGM